MVESPKAAFARMDRNNDGVVDAGEWMAAVQAAQQRRETEKEAEAAAAVQEGSPGGLKHGATVVLETKQRATVECINGDVACVKCFDGGFVWVPVDTLSVDTETTY